MYMYMYNVHMRKAVCVYMYIHICSDILYSRKFSPGENFHLFRPGVSWVKFFGELFYPVKILSHWNFYTHRFYMWLPSSTILVVPHDHQSAVLPGIQNFFFLDLCTVSYFHVAPQVLPDPAGPLSSELSLSAIAEANTAVWTACSKLGPRKLRSER